jgi:hypothetical protein
MQRRRSLRYGFCSVPVTDLAAQTSSPRMAPANLSPSSSSAIPMPIAKISRGEIAASTPGANFPRSARTRMKIGKTIRYSHRLRQQKATTLGLRFVGSLRYSPSRLAAVRREDRHNYNDDDCSGECDQHPLHAQNDKQREETPWPRLIVVWPPGHSLTLSLFVGLPRM